MLTKLNCNTAEMTPRLGDLFCGEKQIVGFILKKRGFTIDPATFDKEALDLLYKEDKIIGMIEFFTVEDNDQDAGTATSSRNEMIETMPGTKGYNFIFNNGSCFQNQIQLLHGSKSYEFIPVFDDGSALWAETADGRIKGFDANLFTGVKKYQTSADVAGSTLRVYITPSAMSYWQGAAYNYIGSDFRFNELTPTTGLTITVPILTAAATTTAVSIKTLCSGAPVAGLTTVANWKMRRNDVLEAVTAVVNSGNENYTFTHAALVAGDEISFEINVTGYPVYVLDTNYYAGKSNVVEVV
ncbi:hypothetical protein ATE47_04175 [Chryseobacterium sp. IHB B 17019]|uniref:hypothetical protein n=1 Tax=Chryseobacterium sp. IHB B 17019 TaxID=1721091 RepID=UPI000720F70E|nr:hypothetical protein [Chryseobacterium sp. IHB B 17019]ALR29766.1 hypothetical protein ATE47_04175 [Chryseobacterium sp. IHB B 17019]